jgi:hypothetical protein
MRRNLTFNGFPSPIKYKKTISKPIITIDKRKNSILSNIDINQEEYESLKRQESLFNTSIDDISRITTATVNINNYKVYYDYIHPKKLYNKLIRHKTLDYYHPIKIQIRRELNTSLKDFVHDKEIELLTNPYTTIDENTIDETTIDENNIVNTSDTDTSDTDTDIDLNNNDNYKQDESEIDELDNNSDDDDDEHEDNIHLNDEFDDDNDYNNNNDENNYNISSSERILREYQNDPQLYEYKQFIKLNNDREQDILINEIRGNRNEQEQQRQLVFDEDEFNKDYEELKLYILNRELLNIYNLLP